MNYYFPTQVYKSKIARYSFSKWSNGSINAYEILRFEFNLSSILSLYRADTICPAPKMPFVDLGYFKSPNSDVEVIVQASAIQYEIALEDYYTYFANASGEKIVEKRLIDNDYDKVDLLLTKTFDDGQTWITRRTGFKTWMGNGVFLVTLNFACNEKVYLEYADLFYFMLQSFKFLTPPEYTLAEKLRLFARKYPIDFATYVPYSFSRQNQHFDTETDMQSTFHKQFRETVTGVLNINALAENGEELSRESILEKFLARHIENGLGIGSMVFHPYKGLPMLSNCEICDHNFMVIHNDHNLNFNLRVFLAKFSNRWLYIDMFGLDQTHDFEIWAINKRAFQLVLEYLKTE